MSNNERQNEIRSALRDSQTHPEGKAWFYNKGISREEMEIICSYIMSSDAATLRSLNLDWNHGIVNQICIALTSSQYCRLHSLSLTGTGISQMSIKSLGEYLISPSSTRLSNLNLSWNNNIGDNEIQILCSALSLNSSLLDLDLKSCNFGDRGAATIKYLLSKYNSSLSNINLELNKNLSSQLKQQVEELVNSKNRSKILKEPELPMYSYFKSKSKYYESNITVIANHQPQIDNSQLYV